MSIIGYRFASEFHCPDCTRATWDARELRYARQLTLDRDEHGLPMFMRDQEDNSVHPIFETDEHENSVFCSDCAECIKETV